MKEYTKPEIEITQFYVDNKITAATASSAFELTAFTDDIFTARSF